MQDAFVQLLVFYAADNEHFETEYYRLYPNDLPELHYENQCALQVMILFDDNREDLSVIDNFGVNVAAIKFHERKKGDSHLFMEKFAQFHEDAE